MISKQVPRMQKNLRFWRVGRVYWGTQCWIIRLPFWMNTTEKSYIQREFLRMPHVNTDKKKKYWIMSYIVDHKKNFFIMRKDMDSGWYIYIYILRFFLKKRCRYIADLCRWHNTPKLIVLLRVKSFPVCFACKKWTVKTHFLHLIDEETPLVL